MSRVCIDFIRREFVGFFEREVVYEIEGSYRPGARGSYDTPDDPDEVEIEEIRRQDPWGELEEETSVDARQRFSDLEIAKIEEMLLERGAEYDYEPADD